MEKCVCVWMSSLCAFLSLVWFLRWLQIKYSNYAAVWSRTRKMGTFVGSDSPSTVRLSSPPWLYTGTRLAWQRQSCQSWWCHRSGHPISSCILFHFVCSVDHKHHLAHMVPAFPLHRFLWKKEVRFLAFMNRLMLLLCAGRNQNNYVKYVDLGQRWM